MIKEPGITRLIQISDLHFVEELNVRGSKFKSKALLAKSHDIRTLSALGAAVQLLKGDVIIATGDLSTDGSKGALRKVRLFLESDDLSSVIEAYPRRIPWRRARRTVPLRGLSAGPDMLALPGNHDRYGFLLPLQLQRGSFEKVFRGDRFPRLPYIYVYPGSGVDRDLAQMVCFAFDSTYPAGKLTMESIAKGQISKRDREWLLDQVVNIRSSGHVYCDVRKKVYRVDTARPPAFIAALHHHPVAPRGYPREERGWLRKTLDHIFKEYHASLVEMEEAREFIAACRASKLQLVAFGHQHLAYQYWDPISETVYSCCPASTKYSHDNKEWQTNKVDDQPGFMYYDFKGGILTRIVLCRWEYGNESGGAFVQYPLPSPSRLQSIFQVMGFRGYLEARPINGK